MSGSPVAAVSMSLFAGGAISDLEAFAMINGSRLGASLIVLVVGFVSYITGRRNPDGLYIGVVAMLTAFTLWAPVVPIGLLVLDQGWLDGAQFSSPGASQLLRRHDLRPGRRTRSTTPCRGSPSSSAASAR